MRPIGRPILIDTRDIKPLRPYVVFLSPENQTLSGPAAALNALETLRKAGMCNNQIAEPFFFAPSAPDDVPVVVAGLDQSSPEKIRICAAKALKLLQSHGARDCTVCLPNCSGVINQAIVEGVLSANHVFISDGPARTKVRAIADLDFATETRDDETRRAVTAAWLTSLAAQTARDLATEPANTLTPDAFMDRCMKLAAQNGLGIKVMALPELEMAGMGGLLAVAAGSACGAYLIQIDWVPKRKPEQKPVVLVGKTVTFDTGGVSIKVAQDMDHMKADMGGGAAVFGLMRMIATLKPDYPVTALFAVAENMPDAAAMRPSDVITTASGKTVEIINTDAEGRLMLADALHYAAALDPRVVIDFATLTGATMGIFGPLGISTFANDDDWFDRLVQADQQAGERVWRLPLWEAYLDFLKSPVADLRNFSLIGQSGSTPTAAAFLSQFIGDHPWLHLDLYNTCWNGSDNTGLMPVGPTGSGTRVAAQMLINLTVSDTDNTKKEAHHGC